MATLRFKSELSGLRQDVIDQLGGGNPMQELSYQTREFAIASLAVIPELRYAATIDNLDVAATVKAPIDIGSSSPSDPTGSAMTVVSIDVPDHMVDDYNVPGSPISKFVSGLIQAFNSAFEALPGGGDSFFQAIGVTDMATQVHLSLEVDIVPPRRRI